MRTNFVSAPNVAITTRAPIATLGGALVTTAMASSVTTTSVATTSGSRQPSAGGSESNSRQSTISQWFYLSKNNSPSVSSNSPSALQTSTHRSGSSVSAVTNAHSLFSSVASQRAVYASSTRANTSAATQQASTSAVTLRSDASSIVSPSPNRSTGIQRAKTSAATLKANTCTVPLRASASAVSSRANTSVVAPRASTSAGTSGNNMSAVTLRANTTAKNTRATGPSSSQLHQGTGVPSPSTGAVVSHQLTSPHTTTSSSTHPLQQKNTAGVKKQTANPPRLPLPPISPTNPVRPRQPAPLTANTTMNIPTAVPTVNRGGNYREALVDGVRYRFQLPANVNSPVALRFPNGQCYYVITTSSK